MLLRTLMTAALGVALLSAPAVAQTPAPASSGVSKSPMAAAAGSYKLDDRHASVIARVAHAGGFSYSTFRFAKVEGMLDWNPSTPTASKLDVQIDPKSITSNVPGFADELAGDKFLNAAKYPEARFVSTAVRITGSGMGQVDGNLTFMGVTKPATLQAELVGAGGNMRGVPTLGFTGTMTFKRSDFGFTAMQGPIGDQIQLMIDVEFNKAA